MSQVRILVLTSSTGGGHDARAQAFAEWVFQLYRHAVDVRIENLLEESSLVGRFGVALYNGIQRRAPWLHHPYYWLIEGLGILNRRTVSFGRRYYRRLLQEYRPHLIFSVHDCLNRGYFELAREVLGERNVRCATYCSEFSGGYGYSLNWVDPTVDLYFARTPTARDFAVKLGMPLEKTRVRGHLMWPRAHFEVLNLKERTRLREKLGLRPDRLTLLLATGGAGANNHLDVLPLLAGHADHCQAIVVCGTNRETYAAVVRWRASHPEFICSVLAYTESMHTLMQISDAIVTRGGTTTCAEALHFGCPIVFNAFGGIMPQEQLTVKFFRNGGGAETIFRPEDFEVILARWLRQPQTFAQLQDNFLKLRYEEDPVILIRELVDLAAAAAGQSLQPQPPFAVI